MMVGDVPLVWTTQLQHEHVFAQLGGEAAARIIVPSNPSALASIATLTQLRARLTRSPAQVDATWMTVLAEGTASTIILAGRSMSCMMLWREPCLRTECATFSPPD
jgi:hypothetical protein